MESAKTYQYYIPQGDHEFLDWMKNFLQVAMGHISDWDLQQQDIDALKAKCDDFSQKLSLVLSEKSTKEDVREKNTAHKTSYAAFKNFVNAKLRYNTKLDNDRRAELRIPLVDNTKTTIAPPTSLLEFSVKPIEIRRLRIDYHDKVSGKKARPRGYSGVLLRWRILEHDEAVPTDPEALNKTKLITRSPHKESFTTVEQGKRIALTLCWQNGRGMLGPFNDIQVHVIP